jgi:uncharacterized protein involved in exopolysaccharide biosynthesis
VGKSVLWTGMVRFKYRVMAAMIIGAVAAVLIGSFITKKYMATAVATYTDANALSSSLKSLTSEFSGLASIAGIVSGGSDNGSSARTMLESRLVAGQLIDKFQLMPELFPRDWDAAHNKWYGSGTDHPSLQKGIDRFESEVLSIDYDNTDNKVSVNVVWPDRVMAATLANAVIESVNLALRKQALSEAESSIAYLNRELEKNSTVEIREAIFTLMQQQMQSSMYANVRQEFALKILDPAVAPDIKKIYWPKKWPLAAVGMLLGLMVAAAGSLIAELRIREVV